MILVILVMVIFNVLVLVMGHVWEADWMTGKQTTLNWGWVKI